MKKLLIMAIAAVMVAGIAQAASLDWQWKDKKADVGSTIYLVLTDTKITELSGIDQLTSEYTLPANGASAEVKNKVTWYGNSATASDAKLTDASSYVFVVANDKGFWCSDVISASGKVYDPSQQQTSPGTQAFNAGTITYSDWKAVPEPCTVALLALGLAAVGLKRKVA